MGRFHLSCFWAEAMNISKLCINNLMVLVVTIGGTRIALRYSSRSTTTTTVLASLKMEDIAEYFQRTGQTIIYKSFMIYRIHELPSMKKKRLNPFWVVAAAICQVGSSRGTTGRNHPGRMPVVITGLDRFKGSKTQNVVVRLSGLTKTWCQKSLLTDCFWKGGDSDVEFCRHSVDKTFKQVKLDSGTYVSWWKGEITGVIQRLYRNYSLVVSSFKRRLRWLAVFSQAGFKGKKGKAPRVREASGPVPETWQYPIQQMLIWVFLFKMLKLNVWWSFQYSCFSCLVNLFWLVNQMCTLRHDTGTFAASKSLGATDLFDFAPDAWSVSRKAMGLHGWYHSDRAGMLRYVNIL